MHQKTIKEILNDLQHKAYSSLELTQHFLNRIKAYNKDLNCMITICEAEALAQAKQADQKITQQQAGKLCGLPIMQKDIFCTQGVLTTCASKILYNFVAPYDAFVVTQFKNAGSVMLGKTNMDEFAMGSSNENSFYGAVKNPWHLDYVPGGSSGGSAAAVAARLTPAATGTDTGGSIRQPAALCGITGIKPTYGRVSRFGMIAFASSLDQGGPMAKTAEDCAILLNVMAGHDKNDSTCVNQAVPDYTRNLNKSIKGLKIGLPKEYFNGLDSKMAQVIENVINEYKKLGAEFKEISLANSDLAISAYYIIAPAECSSNLARFDGVRYGFRCENPKDLLDLYMRTRSEGFGDEVKRRIMIGTYALSAGYYDAYYLKAQKIRRLISEDFKNALQTVDLILGPATTGPAFKIGEKSKDPVEMYLSDIYTIAVNLAGLPGLSMPAGFINGLPVGAQLIGNYFEEAKLLNVAHMWQQQTDWHLKTPQQFQ